MRRILLVICMMLLAGINWADEIDEILPYLIQVESGGNPNAVSNKGAVGLCQITPIVLEEYNNHNPSGWNPQYNIGVLYDNQMNVGIALWYLTRLRDHYLKDMSITYVTHLYDDYLLISVHKKGKQISRRLNWGKFWVY